MPCLPVEIKSSLDSIYLLLLFSAKDRKEFGNKIVFKAIVEELKYLFQKGTEIKTKDGIKTVYFQLGLILGDNLGLHSLLGLVESFNSTYYCRFCKMPKELLEISTVLVENSLRTKEIYESNLQLNNCSGNGIKEVCIWNDLDNFYVTDNYSVDIMHDIFEGVCHFDLNVILNYFINEIKIFSLNTLNSIIRFFNYGPMDEKNRPPEIIQECLKKGHFKMSASEMAIFCRYLGLMIGSYVANNNVQWELYLLLCEIIDIITSKTIHARAHILLQSLIKKHHEIYINIFQKKLKPKHHFMLHYSDIMQQVGALYNLPCMRFEAKHRQFKTAANATTSRKNICHTLSTKHQLTIYCKRLSQPTTTHLKMGKVTKSEADSYKQIKFPQYSFLHNVTWYE